MPQFHQGTTLDLMYPFRGQLPLVGDNLIELASAFGACCVVQRSWGSRPALDLPDRSFAEAHLRRDIATRWMPPEALHKVRGDGLDLSDPLSESPFPKEAARTTARVRGSAYMNRDYVKATVKNRKLISQTT